MSPVSASVNASRNGTRNTSGINGVIADEAPADIHNMKGIKVGTTDNTDNLPSGTYIVKGKTIQLKK